MLVRLLYASRAVDFSPEIVDSLLASSRAINTELGITGVLCYGRGTYLQAIEGGRTAISALYDRIRQDPRHKDVLLLHYEEIEGRQFGRWTMGHVNLSKIHQSTLLKFSEMPELDPYGLSGKASLALLNELVATVDAMSESDKKIVTFKSNRFFYSKQIDSNYSGSIPWLDWTEEK